LREDMRKRRRQYTNGFIKRHRDKVKPELIRMSPSSIRTFETCNASWIYKTMVLPNIDDKKSVTTTSFGRDFHNAAEYNFESISSLYSKKDKEINVYAEVVKGRDYYQYPYENEYYITYKLKPEWLLTGYIDRLCFTDDSRVIIVDYKTSIYANVESDSAQLMTYAYMVWKTGLADPDKIEIVIDYVKSDMAPIVRKLSKSDLIAHHNYLTMLFRRVSKVVNMYKRTNSFKKITHNIDNCTLCPMEGKCIAYHIVFNPHYDISDTKVMPVSDIINELSQREIAWKLNESRSKALKRALLLREEKGNPDVKKLVRDNFNIISTTVKEYQSLPIIDEVAEKCAKMAMKCSPISGMVDTQVIEETIKNVLQRSMPKKLSVDKIPEIVSDNISKFEIVSKRVPYLKRK
jgi:hypothetical protein